MKLNFVSGFQSQNVRYVLILIAFFFFNHTSGQDVQQVEVLKNDKQVEKLFDELGDSEIKLDVFDLLTLPALNFGYEKIIDLYSSYGVEVYLNLDKNRSSRSLAEKFSLNPFYRFYFLNKTDFGGRGLFAEVFVKFSNEPYSEDGEVKSWDIAPGVGIGRKWLNKKGWTFEIMAGFGRYLISDNEATLKGGISIGKRF